MQPVGGLIYATAQHLIHNTLAAVILSFIGAEVLAAAVASALATVLLILSVIGGAVWYAVRRRRYGRQGS